MRNGRHAPQVSLIALVLQDGFLPEFDPVLFLKLANHGLKELKLVSLLLDLSCDFDLDLFLDFSFVHTVSSNLAKELHVLEGPLLQAPLVEIVTEALGLLDCSLFAQYRLDSLVNPLSLATGSPLIHPPADDSVRPVNLNQLSHYKHYLLCSLIAVC